MCEVEGAQLGSKPPTPNVPYFLTEEFTPCHDVNENKYKNSILLNYQPYYYYYY